MHLLKDPPWLPFLFSTNFPIRNDFVVLTWGGNAALFANKSTFMHLAVAFIQSSSQGLSLKLLFYVHAFPGNWTHDLGIANAILYCLSYRNKKINKDLACNKDLILWDFIILLSSFNIKQKSIDAKSMRKDEQNG